MIRFYNTPNRISINVSGNVYILMNIHIVDKFILWAFYCGEIKMDVVELSQKYTAWKYEGKSLADIEVEESLESDSEN